MASRPTKLPMEVPVRIYRYLEKLAKKQHTSPGTILSILLTQHDQFERELQKLCSAVTEMGEHFKKLETLVEHQVRELEKTRSFRG